MGAMTSLHFMCLMSVSDGGPTMLIMLHSSSFSVYLP